VSLILPHIGNEVIVYAGADASQWRLDYVSHLKASVVADYARTQLLSFLYRCMPDIRDICFRYFVLLRPRVRGV
jgi:transposase